MDAEALVGAALGTCLLQELIGQGGMGAVYLAQQSRPRRQVAVKVLFSPSLDTSMYLERFRREADAVASLEHPNIVPVYEYGEQYGLAYLVMPHIKGGSLQDCLTREGRLPLDTVANYLDQIAASIDYAHKQGMLHRDIKPANILMTAEERLLLADFGLVKIITGDQSLQPPLTDPFATPGTPAYMSPEQAFGEEIGPQADLYSLGIVLYQMVTGTIPFQGSPMQIINQHLQLTPPSPRWLRPDLPIAAEQVILRALAKRPEERYSCAKDLADAFRMASAPINISPIPPTNILPTRPNSPGRQADQAEHREPKKLSSRRLFLQKTSLVAATTLIAGATIYATYMITDSKRQPPTGAYAQHTHVATPTIDTTTPYNSPMFGFDTAHTRFNPYEHIINSSNVTRLARKWAFPLGGEINSSPVVVNNVVYAGSYDGYLHAIDVNTGQQKWTAPIGSKILSSPAVANDLVYIGSQDHNLYAFDTNTSQQKWTFATRGVINSSPVVVNGVVYVGSYDHKLYAIDANTGQQKWAFATENIIFASPAVANGVVYIGSRDEKLYALDANTGQQKWAFLTGGSINSSPTVANNTVYVGSQDHKLYAFNASTGEQKWASLTGSNIDSSPAVANGIVYVGSWDHKFYAIDANTGQQKWTFAAKNGIFASPIVANGIVYVGSWDHRLYALDTITGQKRWDFMTGNSIQSSPVVANGVVYVGSKDGNLYAFHIAS